MSHAKQYYLETSSIRKVGGNLQQVGAIDECRTSAFVLFELLTGLRENHDEYSQRKPAIAAVLDSGIAIEWSLPMSRLKQAYKKLQYHRDDESTLRPIIDSARESSSSGHFVDLMNERQLMHSLEELERKDNDLAEALRVIAEHDSFRHGADAFFAERPPGATEDEKERIYRQTRRWMDSYCLIALDAVVDGIAYKCAVECIGEPTQEELEEISKSYDGSVRVFMKAFSYALVQYQARTVTPGKNDLADLLHLVYLRDGDVLVSEEGRNKAVAQATKAAGIPVQCIASLSRTAGAR